ncbi:MAG TPA: sulfurtransferase [Vicinamibacterales bacterium]|jgi:thiosulfate/3-mercaptopyruvate sulfurtransferase|nr:sulfurtransferase [Vicinamibacterales bacterium]
MSYTTLITTEVLATRLLDPNVAVVDCRYKLDDEAWGRRQYAARHIPGAVYVSLGHDLAGPRTGTSGRHPLPDPRTFAQTLGRLGIGSGVQVVAYDQDNGMYASRLWWMLRWLGHDAGAVLDGGFAKWTAEGRAMTSGGETRAPREFVASPRSEMVVDAARVSASLKTGESTLVDARAPERYRGETEPIDKTPGHIPGAANHFFQWNLDEHGMFRTPDALRERLQQSIGEVPPDRLVCYCGSGVTACHNLLALEHAGLRGAKLYPGSWSEWSSDPARPVERG